MKYLFLCLAFIGLLTVACEEKAAEEDKTQVEDTADFKLSSQAEDLYQIVGEKHDTAMLLMKNIEQAKSALRLKMEGLETGAEKDAILDLLMALKKADDGMMNWMREFKSTELNDEEYKAMSEQEIMAYLKKEEQKIEQVHIDMLTSIENGKKFLEK
ncbi:hypothetical protein [Aureispira anguillae]|uniref:Viral A-type inclusion protein n=1 Tax=Aureispira anguillae TaxID=2864201 RepID=A0A916DSH7_9BACT|nr:hypothetical protein [Aureispira anguillae]BDS11886.1 hypothetical protein AsAng_0026000 [Aureispira anguillae]